MVYKYKPNTIYCNISLFHSGREKKEKGKKGTAAGPAEVFLTNRYLKINDESFKKKRY